MCYLVTGYIALRVRIRVTISIDALIMRPLEIRRCNVQRHCAKDSAVWLSLSTESRVRLVVICEGLTFCFVLILSWRKIN